MPQAGENLQSAQRSPLKTRQRASIACQVCNNKRVKCDASSIGLPCSNCARSGKSCRLIKSRRGQRKERSASEPWNDSIAGVIRQAPSENSVTRPDQLTSPARDESHDESQRVSSQRRVVDPSVLADVGSVRKSDQGQAALVNVRQNSPTGYLSPTNDVSHSVIATESQIQTSLHAQLSEVDRFSVLEARQERYDFLAMQQAFKVPQSDVCLHLFRTFFDCVSPSFAVIDRTDFISQYAIIYRPPSWLLLQAVLFSASAHCEENLLRKAGFESRSNAREIFFKRAKALYDADHEKDKFTIVQATFLMSFRWDSLTETKDNWHWLGLSINLALSIGLHRSTKHSGMPLKTQRLWKILWWSLFSEDKYQAVALGRPSRSRSCDCDVEPLEMADFEGQPYGFGHSFKIGLPKVIMAFPVCSTSLAKITERVNERSSSLSKLPDDDVALCDGMLQVWKAGLPEFYQLKPHDRVESIWPSMIQIAACWLKVVLYQPTLQIAFPIPVFDNAHKKSIEAADQMIHLVEDLLVSEKIKLCPIHIIPALYAAMSVYASTIRSSQGLFQRLAHVKYNICVVALQELQSAWPMCRFIISAFTQILSNLSTERSLGENQINNQT